MNEKEDGSKSKGWGFLSGGALKILACVLMAIDHAGAELFPSVGILRIIGRLSFPIFAFFIAEGSRYSKDPLKRLLTIFVLGCVFDAVYFLYSGSYYGNIMLTFSLSLLLIMLLNEVKRRIFLKEVKIYAKILWGMSFIVVTAAVFFLVKIFRVDYGFAGVMLPVVASLLDFDRTDAPEFLKKINVFPVRLAIFAVGLLFLVWQSGFTSRQAYCLLALVPLAFYNGKRGKSPKYLFYVFYPAHLLLIALISYLMSL